LRRQKDDDYFAIRVSDFNVIAIGENNKSNDEHGYCSS
jgi:hypothetical protein